MVNNVPAGLNVGWEYKEVEKTFIPQDSSGDISRNAWISVNILKILKCIVVFII